MRFEFSSIGLIISILILMPSLLFFTLFPPKNAPAAAPAINPIFTLLERVGQGAVFMVLIFLTKPDFSGRDADVWAMLTAVCFVLYYIMWIRYLARGRDRGYLTKAFLFIPIPLAVFPVCALLFASLWGESLWLCIATVIFAVGHLAVSWASAVSDGNT
ncbi:hypothetical protein V3851_07930 [Paenibacillus sp. M1]|uniref:Uncharacterized protein n=1 Tax=Paenibacillus haidiansis TaxID=1574488 RepID=A0ABU7VPR4_9BACL